ncbi:alpha/beta hydrolase [Caloramator sp. E03]|uniref:alpha/beta hydrolase family protein n=1 Tax=Caloramator sp. E03 TaxID=2576307 RepID=UPI0011109FFE|nr:alpha/beta fold hydrolase [Caloramator sp. E03]QCX34687.1 alpha/beta hydrolase [Caloramator sp. E03]
MPYIKDITGVQQFDFQINRVLTYGKAAADEKEIVEKAGKIKNFEQWFDFWVALGEKYEGLDEYMRAAYAYRMAEFFLKEDHPQKDTMYEKSVKNFYNSFQQMKLDYEIHEIPYMGKEIHSIIFRNKNEKGILLVCGGYDSFIEEFVPALTKFVQENYTIILFEGDGQGKTLKNGLKFIANWERPTSCVLDYYGVKECTMIGISWGGYLALRAAAFEKRIKAVVAYDVLENGFDCMTNIFPGTLKPLVRYCFAKGKEKIINRLLGYIRKRSLLADWAMMQGMYITGTNTPYDFYKELQKHNLSQDVCDKLNCHVLLLAGEKDHYIPKDQFYRLTSKIKYAKSLSTRMFTEAEGGEQHCQIGNHHLAIEEIFNWIKKINNL